MKRLVKKGEEDRPPIDTPQSDTRRMLKTGGVSLLFHLFLIFFLLLYLGGGSGRGGDGKGGSSIYHVTIRPLSTQSDSNPSPQRGVVTKTHISTAEKKQSAPVPQASTQQTSSVERSETEPEDSIMGSSVDGQGTGEGGAGSGGSGDGTGRGLFGLKGFGSSRVSSPRYIENPKPVYPLEARQKEYEGKVLLRVEVLTNGRVGKVEVEKSSGYKLFDQAALEAMKTWRFIPAKRGKVPFRSWVNIVITFQLRDSEF